MSDPVNTATTPAASSAAVVSIERIRAWGRLLLTNAAWRTPGGSWSATKSPLPTSSRSSSTLVWGVPT